ncbi:MAG: hypothetical protein UX90_C0002G0137 [Candidatus Wolfebacteria bacterium GW2011_GWD2_47_17]|nr:MAG: hypothetical protein UX90_C0002G0137 [Candidatus Wolfebacteria bacterium GW2011_GWD2_47_17]
MQKVLVVMQDDVASLRDERISYEGGIVPKRSGAGAQCTREILSEIIALAGIHVVEAKDEAVLSRAIDEQGAEIGVALVVQQGAGNYESLKYLEKIRSTCGERIVVIGIAESVQCMEAMVTLRVDKLLGAPLGNINLDELLKVVQGYVMK